MNNIMTFENNYKAVITYDPEIEMFRGEFIGLNGGADFYAKDLEGLKQEGKSSLDMFLQRPCLASLLCVWMIKLTPQPPLALPQLCSSNYLPVVYPPLPKF